jgi:hypothetical protein
MREIVNVIQEMKKSIPAGNEEVFSKLDSIHQSASFSAPEMMGEWWQQLSVVVSELVGQPPLDTQTEVWKLQVVAILTESNLESVKENFLKK